MLRFSKSRLLALILATIILLTYAHWIGFFSVRYRKDEWSDPEDWSEDSPSSTAPPKPTKPLPTHPDTADDWKEPETSATLEADIVKRDEIVEAFKVRAFVPSSLVIV
ncbi:hypothetical protein BJ912DRAFT_957624 [Pholiota molesta]|nr:hypothetical protein BJ912DRAFT_957624 [Pholiota molesta]